MPGIRRGEVWTFPLFVHRVDGRVEPGRRVKVGERVEQAALAVEAGADPRDEDTEAPTPPPWTLRCILKASPTEQHPLRSFAYRVGAASGSLMTAGNRSVNVEPWPSVLSTVGPPPCRPIVARMALSRSGAAVADPARHSGVRA